MEDKKFTVRAAERALDILLCFTEKREWSLTEIAQHTGLNKSTVYRLLVTLEGKGFLRRNPETEKYRLGFRIWELSANLSQSDDPAVVVSAGNGTVAGRIGGDGQPLYSGRDGTGPHSSGGEPPDHPPRGTHRRSDASDRRRLQQSVGGLCSPGDAGDYSKKIPPGRRPFNRERYRKQLEEFAAEDMPPAWRSGKRALRPLRLPFQPIG